MRDRKLNTQFKDVVLEINDTKDLAEAKQIVFDNGQIDRWCAEIHHLNKYDKFLFFNPMTNLWVLSFLDKKDVKVDVETFEQLFKEKTQKFKLR